MILCASVASPAADPADPGMLPQDQLATAILKNDILAARKLIDGPPPDASPDDWASLAKQAARILDWPEVVCASFRDDIGKTVMVASPRGTISGTITRIGANEVFVRGSADSGFAEQSVSVLALAPADRDRRLKEYTAAEKAIVTAMVALRTGTEEEAVEALQQATDSPLAALLLANLQRSQDATMERDATGALRQLLEEAGFGSEQSPSDELLKAIRARDFGTASASAIQKRAADFTSRFGRTQIAFEWASITAALATIGPRAQVLEEATVTEAIAALKTKNRIDGDFLAFPEIQGGTVALNLAENDELKDLSPLEDLPVCDLDLTRTGVRSLTPLKSMPLNRLVLDGTPLTSLRGLEGCPLRSLSMTNTAIDDLRPLKSAQLESANLARSKIRSLAGLEGAPLKDLDISETLVTDIKALAGAPLTNLNATYCTALVDIRPLANSPLQYLYLALAGVYDFRPIARMPLRVLHCSRLTDLSLLAEAPLDWLIVSYSTVTDLRPLAGKQITSLSLSYCPELSDLSPLADLPLVTLDLTGCPKVDELAPLKGMPLTTLLLDGTTVGDDDMAVIRNGLPKLVTLFLGGCKKVNSLDFLLSLSSLSSVSLPPGVNAVPVLKQHPTILTVYENGLAIDVKEYIATHGGGKGN